MSTRNILLSLLILFLVYSATANAYELATHAVLTQKAAERSILKYPQLLIDLGLTDAAELFGKRYLDIAGATVNARDGYDFEKSFMPKGSQDYSIVGWLMRGAIREDDLPSPIGKNPQDDPYGNIFRVFNHFYDPIFDRPLTVGGIPPGSLIDQPNEPAPNWAIGTSDALTNSPAPNSYRRNHFTVFDAREAMYRALTGRDGQGSPIAPMAEDRNKYWATTFRALGDVVHLLQDMAQPQHTRNEAHCGVSYSIPLPACGHKSLYESYIEARATGSPFSTASGKIIPVDDLVYDDGYPIPQFANYTSYFTTRHLDTGVLDRRGLADYSNRGFFTAGKNLGDGEYSYPPNNPRSYIPEALSQDWTGAPLPNAETVTLLDGAVSDTLAPSRTRTARLTTRGVWDQFLESKGFFPSYTLNRYNYDDMAGLLIPRAVAYSAGLINYFFRGRLDFVADPNNAGAYIIKNLGPEDMTGNFTLYYDAVDGKRYPVAGDTPTTTWAGLTIVAKGQADNRRFTPPTDPAPTSPGEYTLVFNGDMGEEKAIPGQTVGAIAAKQIEAPGFYAMTWPFDSGAVLYYSKNGILQKSLPSGLRTNSITISGIPPGLAVYNGIRYTSGLVDFSSNPLHPAVFINGTTRLDGINTPTAVAANSKGVYVYEYDPVPDPSNVLPPHAGEIEHYTLDGSFVDSFSTSDFIGGSFSMAANESALCAVFGAETGEWAGALYSFSGNLKNKIPLTWSEGCTLTQDRAFFADWPNFGDWVVNEYDLDGNKLDSVSIGSYYRVEGLAATEDRLYVGVTDHSFNSKVLIFNRIVQRDSGHAIISDTFTYDSSTTDGVVGQYSHPTAIAVDWGKLTQ